MSFKLEISGSTLGLQSWKSLLAMAEWHWMVSFILEWFDVQRDVAEDNGGILEGRMDKLLES